MKNVRNERLFSPMTKQCKSHCLINVRGIESGAYTTKEQLFMLVIIILTQL